MCRWFVVVVVVVVVYCALPFYVCKRVEVDHVLVRGIRGFFGY